jgi:hypothetical protein
MPNPPHHGSARRPQRPSEARQQKRRRGGYRQKEAVLLKVGDRDEDDDRSWDDGRYFVVRGRPWRMANSGLDEANRTILVGRLMAARRAVRKAKKA